MDADKQKALEAAGWKFGSVDEFLGERPMSDSDKMREEFETVVRREGWSIRRSKGDSSEYWSEDTNALWQWWKTAYAAGRKAEREAIRLKNWDGIRLGTTNKPEGEG